MPKGDRTGPYGEGPQTGRGLGFCAGNRNSAHFVAHRGRRGAGFGRAYGRGNGFGNHNRRGGFGAGYSAQEYFQPINEKTLIENEINILKDQLAALEERLNQINKE